MLNIKFINRKGAVKAFVEIIKEGVVLIKPTVEIADNNSGFYIYSDELCEHLVGDYSTYRTKYKDTDEMGMYLSSGEVYVKPVEPIPEPVPKPTAEEIAEEQKQAAIQNKLQQINELKRQIDSSDYKIIKSYEYSVLGLTIEYDIPALHVERQALRDQINILEIELEELEA